MSRDLILILSLFHSSIDDKNKTRTEDVSTGGYSCVYHRVCLCKSIWIIHFKSSDLSLGSSSSATFLWNRFWSKYIHQRWTTLSLRQRIRAHVSNAQSVLGRSTGTNVGCWTQCDRNVSFSVARECIMQSFAPTSVSTRCLDMSFGINTNQWKASIISKTPMIWWRSFNSRKRLVLLWSYVSDRKYRSEKTKLWTNYQRPLRYLCKAWSSLV